MISGPLLDFAPARQTYDALRARIIYLDRTAVPKWQQAVLQRDKFEVPQIEPPIMENLAAAGYQVVGAERTWVPRVLSIIFWSCGGVFVFLVARRLAGDPGPIVSVAIYLLMPFAIFASRSFQPDPLMVMLTMAAVLTIQRFHERPTPGRLAFASAVSAFAILSKPPIPIFFLWSVFAALALQRDGFTSRLKRRSTLFFATASSLPSLAYYVWGTFIDSFLRGHTQASLEPRLLLHASYWKGWVGMVATVLAYPAVGLAGVPSLLIVGALLGTLAVSLQILRRRSGSGFALLFGLLAGYFVFGLTFTLHISTHLYYSLPLVPIVALGAAPLSERAWKRLRVASPFVRVATLAACVLVAAGAGLKVERRYSSSSYGAEVRTYQEVGVATHHTAAAVSIDPLYTTPLLYYGWLGSSPLYAPDGQRVSAGQLRSSLSDLVHKFGHQRFLVVTALGELANQDSLRMFLRRRPEVISTPTFVIYSLRTSTGP
jgi:4-amino-4-deoxy-L-arabinose transferase-like glycosyltransferase